MGNEEQKKTAMAAGNVRPVGEHEEDDSVFLGQVSAQI